MEGLASRVPFLRRREASCARLEAEIAKTDGVRVRLTTANLRSLDRDGKEDPLRAQERHQRFQFHRSQARLRARHCMMAQKRGLQWTLLRRRGSAVLKKLVTKQMTQIVEACSQIQDLWLTKACTRPCGMQERSVLMMWHWQKRTRQPCSSDGSKPRRGSAVRSRTCSF